MLPLLTDFGNAKPAKWRLRASKPLRWTRRPPGTRISLSSRRTLYGAFDVKRVQSMAGSFLMWLRYRQPLHRPASIDRQESGVDSLWTGRGSLPRSALAGIPQIETAPAYLVKGIIPRIGLCVFWGSPKCGKSFLALDVLMHVALGWKFRDLRVRQGPVVYCAFEGQARLSNRVEAFRQRKLSEDTGDVPFFLVAASMNLVADHSALIASVRAALGDTKPTAICLDTLNRSLVGSESSDEDMAAYVRAADALREAFECVVIIVHHCGIDATRPRGHTSLTGAVDAQIAIKRDAQDNIIAAVEFMKDGPQGAELASRLEVVELGIDEDGDTIMSCIVVPVEGAATPTRKAARPKLAKGAKIALRALHDAIGECGAIPPASNPYPGRCKNCHRRSVANLCRKGRNNPKPRS
jgi:AAA domain